MKKINFGFKKKNNKDVIVKRNWKKVWIWTAVVAILIGAIIPAIYIPVRNHNAEQAKEPMPSSLNSASVDEAINKAHDAEEATDVEEKVWGLYIDIEENEKSDFAIYGGKESSDEEEGEFDKSEFNGPFSTHAEYTTYDWLTFYDKTSEEATDMLAEFIWEIYSDTLDTEYGEVTEQYFHISMLNGDINYDDGNLPDPIKATPSYMKVNKVDQTTEGDKEDVYELSFGPDGSTSVSGPMWLTFQGDDLVFVVTDIEMEAQNTITTAEDFDELMNQTVLYEYEPVVYKEN